LLDLDKNYYGKDYDIVILSGVTCFLSQKKLKQCFTRIHKVLKTGGLLFIQTNHPDSYFKKAKSNWLQYISYSFSSRISIKFRNSKWQVISEGDINLHTKQKIIKLLKISGFRIKKIYEPLATKEDLKNFPHMWIDEDKIPFHLALIAERI